MINEQFVVNDWSCSTQLANNISSVRKITDQVGFDAALRYVVISDLSMYFIMYIYLLCM